MSAKIAVEFIIICGDIYCAALLNRPAKSEPPTILFPTGSRVRFLNGYCTLLRGRVLRRAA